MYDEIRNFIFLFQIFALCPFGRNGLQNCILCLYTLLHFVILVVLSLVALYYNNFVYDSNAISALVVGLLFVGNLVTVVVTVLQALLTRYDLKNFLLEIGSIDEMFEIKLRLPIDYATLRRKYLFKVTAMLLISSGLLLFLVMFLALGSRQPTFIFWLPISFSFVIINMRIMQNIFFVDLLRERLEFLNQRLVEIAQRRSKKSKLILYVEVIEDNNDHRSRRLKNAQLMRDEFDEVLALKRIYAMIWNSSILLNDCFGWSVLAIVTRSFIGFTCHGYWLFLGFKSLIEFDLIVDSAVNIVLIAMQLSALCLSCYNCTGCAEDTGRLLSKIEKRDNNEPFNFLVREFSLQILHERIILSANGFFTINLDLLGSLAAAAASYLVILMQFQSSESDKAMCEDGIDGNDGL